MSNAQPSLMPPLCQIFSPVSLFKVTNVPWAPPGVTTTMSPTMSGDSEYPQPGKPPPNPLLRLTCHSVFPVDASRHVTSPLPPSTYTRSPSTVGVPRGPSPIPLR